MPERYEDEAWPETLDDAADRILAEMSDEDRALVAATSEGDLVRFHDGWGTGIRNELGLWNGNTELLAACGSPTMHADDASGVIIRAVWNKLRGLPAEAARVENYRSPEQVLRAVGPDALYRQLTESGKMNEQEVYKLLRMLFRIDYRQFKALERRPRP